ncbi:MAG: HlyC/CorC family transporter [Anaerolineaceae bacterium]|nr:MAG: HlyC/CorC family transporter [Anaerolineaceae bacterium]
MSKLFLLFLGIPGMSFLLLIFEAAEGELPSITVLAIPMVIILLLILLNGLYVASEFAIIGVRPTQMEELVNEGNNKAQKVLDVVESRSRQDQYIATAQLGITIASLGLAMYGEPRISHFIEAYLVGWLDMSESLARGVGYFVALGLLTYLHVVLGEMVPKTLALIDASGAALQLTRPMQVSQTILNIPVRVLNGIGNLLLKLFRVPPAHGQSRLLAPEELELIVVESAEGGLIEEDAEEMIRNIFDFSDRTVGQIMSPRIKVQAIPLDIPRDQLLALVTESRHSRFPVYDTDLDHIVGILHLKDLIRQSIKPSTAFDLRLVLRTAPAVPEDQFVETLLAVFKQQRLHMAVVLDEFGGMAGIVTLEDLVEEVVGEVRDEFDLEKEPYVEVAPGVLEVAGDYLVDDLIEEVYIGDESSLPDVETVGGLVITQLGRPPLINDEVVYNEQVHIKVLDVDRRAVARVRIEFPVPETDENVESGAAANNR